MTSLMLNNWYVLPGRYVQYSVFETQCSQFTFRIFIFTLHSLDSNSNWKFLFIYNDQFVSEAKLLISSSFHLHFKNVFCLFHALFHCSALWSSPVSSSEACLTRTPFGMKYLFCTPVAAVYNVGSPSALFTTFAFSFVPGKIHCNCTKRAACPTALSNGSGL